VKLSVGNTAQVARAVSEGAADLGFVEGRIEDPALVSEAVGSDRLIVVVAPAHPWSGRRALSAEDLASADWVLREPGSGTRSEFEAAVARLGAPPDRLNVVMELPSNEAVRAAVEAGAGATAISELVAEPGLKSGSLRRADVDFPERAFLILRHRERYLSKVGEAFLTRMAREPQAAS
jgi:DNA-binding transcriptional LysR family regulator